MITAAALATDDAVDTPLTPRACHFALFDATLDPAVGYSSTTICNAPGAADSLRVWAALHRIDIEERDYGYGQRYVVAKSAHVEIAVAV